MPAERISKVLAEAGIASRRGSDALIGAGRVTVDGRPATLGERVDPVAQAIAVDGRPIGVPVTRPLHLAVHKPIGVTSTVRDRHAARTVLELVGPDVDAARLFPVGRLDRDSEGLILLTNDGDWAERVLHPRYGVEREYAVAVDRPLEPAAAAALEHGIPLEEGVATLRGLRPQTRTETRALAELVSPPIDPRLVWYRAVLAQGWRRQLRRMFGAVGLPVRRLVRVRIGTVRIDDLRSGEVRRLTSVEARRLVGMGHRS
ncbi:MAG TPA: pseudouridine synthase [Candidatus Limnocylindrales bacterium]|nr:pseudouridine synthase [Candidatus Limnocylindrales bacterium]